MYALELGYFENGIQRREGHLIECRVMVSDGKSFSFIQSRDYSVFSRPVIVAELPEGLLAV